MKFPMSILLLTAWVLTSCDSVDEPPPSHNKKAATRPPANAQQYPQQPQPFDPNGPAVPPDGAPPENGGQPQQPAPPSHVAKGDYPYGIPVPNKPHLVESPYSPGKYVDVEGFAPGTEVKDPYTQKIFLVP
jgi:hypothetical protein